MSESSSELTADPAVEVLIARAQGVPELPAGEHKLAYSEILAGLERELNADPSASVGGA